MFGSFAELNDGVELTGERMVAGGDALGHAPDGRVVLIDGALPGERVEVQITSDRSDMLRARVAAVLDASPDRVTPPCAFARAGCGGCGWQHVAPHVQPQLKLDVVRDALRRIARVDDPPLGDPVPLPPTGYRSTVRALVVDGRAAFRRRASHEPITIESCLVAHPLVDDVLRNGRFGEAREVTVRASVATRERCLLPDPSHATIDVADDVQIGSRASVTEVVDGTPLRVSIRSFFQTRPDGATVLARLVRNAVGPNRTVADLYCGVGLFAARLDSPLRVVAVERASSSVRDARHNLRHLPARVVRSDVDAFRPEPVEVVIADPSRRGVGRAGVRTIERTGAGRVVLVSCDAAALARDVSLLHASGFDLRSVTLVDLFPHTPHIEAVSVLER